MLAVFTVKEISAMQDLLSALDLENRKLSKVVKSETAPKGLISLDGSFTKFLRNRAAFIQT